MIHREFFGTGTALVTPFKADQSIDFDAFGALLDFQIANNVEAVVVCGSTGESATLSDAEKIALVRFAVERVDGRLPVIAGSGSNNTAATIALTKKMAEAGANAVLLVAPYYNKPGQEGLYNHYLSVAESVDIPQILYNVPGRAGVSILPETQLRLAEQCQNIIATKEASADLESISEIIRSAPQGFAVLSGDDSLTLPVIACGGKGVIAVISNYAPLEFGNLVRAAFEGDYATARSLHFRLLDLMKVNFIESNPIPVKAALALMGKIQEIYRLPMTPLQASHKSIVSQTLRTAGFLR